MILVLGGAGPPGQVGTRVSSRVRDTTGITLNPELALADPAAALRPATVPRRGSRPGTGRSALLWCRGSLDFCHPHEDYSSMFRRAMSAAYAAVRTVEVPDTNRPAPPMAKGRESSRPAVIGPQSRAPSQLSPSSTR